MRLPNRSRRSPRAVLFTLVLATVTFAAFAPAARAHKPSDSYLTVNLQGEHVAGRWDISLRDLEVAVGLDSNGDGDVTWGELRSRHEAVTAYALARLDLTADGRPCTLQAGPQQVAEHSDGAYAVLHFDSDCPAGPGSAIAVDYRLLFDLDPLHRGLLRLQGEGTNRTAILSPAAPRYEAPGVEGAPWRELWSYFREGVHHIWIGFDHLLFLFVLLLPAVLRREEGRWRGSPSFTRSLWEVAQVVTAFTVAHSVTLALAALGWIQLPSRWVESAIAATVVVAALHNFVPAVKAPRWGLAFALGLIHGFGFAGVLLDLGLPAGALVRALLGFNLGVEAGQLALVAVALPLAYLARESWFYRRVAFGAGSLAAAAVGLAWLLDRVLDLGFMPI